MKVFIDFVDDDETPAMEVDVAVVPRIGEKVGVRTAPGGIPGEHYALDTVVDVRHYFIASTRGCPEIRVLTSAR